MSNEKLPPPSTEDILDDMFPTVHEHFDNDWRHGGTQTIVVFREEDQTYWRYVYRLSTDGEYNGLKENDYIVEQVEPVVVQKTDYKPVSKIEDYDCPCMDEIEASVLKLKRYIE